MFPYKLQVTQELHEEDLASREAMSEALINKIDSDSNFLKNLIFSDESTFYLNGVVNRHNCRILGTKPPKETIFDFIKSYLIFKCVSYFIYTLYKIISSIV